MTTADQFSNFGLSLLAGGAGGAGTALNPADTSLTVTTGEGVLFPASGPFMLLLTFEGFQELVQCTARTNDTFTVTRAQENTTALTFPVGSEVRQLITAGNMSNIWADLLSLNPSSSSVYNVKTYGAVADGVVDYNASITASSTTLTTTTSPGPFTSAMTGRSALVRGAGASGGDLWATVTYVSATQLTLSVAASVTVSGVAIYILNTDDMPALQSAMNACVAAGGGEVYLPAGVYLVDIHATAGAQVTSQHMVTVRGAGRDATILVCSGALSTGTVSIWSAAPGASITVQDMTMIAPPNPNGHACRAVWHQGTAGRLAAYRCNVYNFATCFNADSGAGVEEEVADCDMSTSPVLDLGGSTVFAGDILRVTCRDNNVHDFGVVGSNQNHGYYLHQGVDIIVEGCRFWNQRGTGFGFKLGYNGTGVATNARATNCIFENGVFGGILSSDTVRSLITGCRFDGCNWGVYVNGDADIEDCQFANIPSGGNAILNSSSNPTATHVDIRNCWFNPVTATGIFPLKFEIAGDVWRIEDCDFTCNRAAVMYNFGGGTYSLVGCSFADDGIDHMVIVSSLTPTIGSLATNMANASVVGNDAHGYIQFDVQTSTIASDTSLATITFATPYAAAPTVILTNQTTNVNGISYGVSAVGTASFVLRNIGTLGVTTSNRVGYFVIS